MLGDHRSARVQVRILAHRAGPLERAAACICREAGARFATSDALREMNFDVPATDGQRIEVVANGPLLWQGAQIAVDTTLVSPVQGDGRARPGADARPALALQHGLRASSVRTPSSSQAGADVVVGLEVGGRFDGQALALLRRLSRSRPRPSSVGAGGRGGRAHAALDDFALTETLAQAHDAAVLRTRDKLLFGGEARQLSPGSCLCRALQSGGLRLHSADEARHAAYGASCVDALPAIQF